MSKTCTVTGQHFEISPQEISLRKKLGVEGEPEYHPVFRFMQLGSFWQHFNLFKRKCDKTGKDIVAVYSEDCPYPVWDKEEWIRHADPEGADFDSSQEIFPQLWSFFQKSPIAHNINVGNTNCEYADDWWYSKDCYLSHSGWKCENVRHSYRIISSRHCQYCVFCLNCELCRDVIYSENCFKVIHSLNCRNCSDSAFLYDCRNCNNCFLSSNLRNKNYYFKNQKCTKEEYEKKLADWDLNSRSSFEKAETEFDQMLTNDAWHRAIFIDHCEDSSGNYLDKCKNCNNCYLLTNDAEDCINVWRGVECKDSLDCVSPGLNHCELLYYVSIAQDASYNIKLSANVIQCKHMEYCAHCFQCENCFGCCGLVGKKYCILNKQYSEEEYEQLKSEIIEAMKKTGEYDKFFPGYFAACPYSESLSGYYWPLDEKTTKQYGFRFGDYKRDKLESYQDRNDIPDIIDSYEEILKKTFWDDEFKRPFQIAKEDIEYANKIGCPINNSYYVQRLHRNFRYIPFDGFTRTTTCAKCSRESKTSWEKKFDGRILCEECYLSEVY